MASSARVEVGEHSIAYRLAGSGPCLVLLHGFLCDSRVWRRELEDLSDQFSVVAWDAPGAGESGDPPDPFTIKEWADTYAGWKGSLGQEAAEQRLARCLQESSLPADEFVARWVPGEFFTGASPELRDEMASVVSGFQPAWVSPDGQDSRRQ